MRLKIQKEDLRAIDEHSLKCFPVECCGLLVGERANADLNVEDVISAENIEESATIFEIDAEFVYNAIVEAESRGLALIGIYHSHPNASAHVSGRDAEFLALWPDVAWLIVGATKEKNQRKKGLHLQGW
ncbi:MAG: M67 family metallopeptidase [Candidatus Hodarchaeaceae archaeon]|nr:M67 family metallopeptidase [Candidatus Hodarchaeaceae archaeon]